MRYCRFRLWVRVPSIFSTSNSCSLSIRVGSGGSCVRFGNKVGSFARYGRSSDAWNVAWILDLSGRSNLKELSLNLAVILKGPSNLARNFLGLSLERCRLSRRMRSPILNW